MQILPSTPPKVFQGQGWSRHWGGPAEITTGGGSPQGCKHWALQDFSISILDDQDRPRHAYQDKFGEQEKVGMGNFCDSIGMDTAGCPILSRQNLVRLFKGGIPR